MDFTNSVIEAIKDGRPLGYDSERVEFTSLPQVQDWKRKKYQSERENRLGDKDNRIKTRMVTFHMEATGLIEMEEQEISDKAKELIKAGQVRSKEKKNKEEKEKQRTV